MQEFTVEEAFQTHDFVCKIWGLGGDAQPFRGLAALTEELQFLAPMQDYSQPPNSSFRGSDALFWFPQALYTLAHTHTQTHSCT